MSLDINEGSPSDDEIFFGKITMKEVKKRVFWDKPYSISAVNSPRDCENNDESLKIIQTQSAPNLLPGQSTCGRDYPETINGWDMREDDSFIKLENMVDKLCVSSTPATCKKTEPLNNTLELIDYILNNPPSAENKMNIKPENVTQEVDTNSNALNEACYNKLQEMSPHVNRKIENITMDYSDSPLATPVKSEKAYSPITEIKTISDKGTEKINIETVTDCNILNELCLKTLQKTSPQKSESKKVLKAPQSTPVKSGQKCGRNAGYMTPVDTKVRTMFKTPGQPLSHRKPSATSLKKTPSKLNTYQHISSPVASYIKNCPIVPLLKDVHPKKPLPGPSSIPKLKNSIPVKTSNKENVNLPLVAYKSAKKTEVIDIPDEKRLPESQWAKKIMTSLPRAMVMKHDHRELNFAKRKLLPQQGDSFADLSACQADVSICTKKSALKNK